MTNPITAADVLERAAELIEKPGAWTQGRMERRNEDGSVCRCALGAIDAAALELGEWSLRVPAGKTFASLLGSNRTSAVIIWNDADHRTQPEVVKAMRKAAALARSEAA